MTIGNPFHYRVRQCYPMHLSELRRYPNANLIFITADHHCVHFIRQLRGICLYCADNAINYDFAFSFEREAWVLYSKKSLLARTMQLAQGIQLCGASKILVVSINTQFISKAAYAKYTPTRH